MPHNRRRQIALLLILLLSHAALTLHVSTHVPIDPTKCEYCAGHANPGHAIAYAGSELLPPTAIEFSAVGLPDTVQFTTPVVYRQRAPPSLI